MGQAEINLSLHPKQAEAFHSTATEILFGGSAGPGKSHAMRISSIVWASEIPGLQVYLFRRLYDDLIKNHLEGPKGYRALLAPWVDSKFCRIVDDEIRFWNGSKIYLCHCQHEKDRFKYQGAEIHVLLIDELTHFSEVIYRFLRGRCRAVGISIPPKYDSLFPRIMCGSNPGGVGHQWVKTAFIDGAEAGQLRQMSKEEGGMVRQFIRARLSDNPSLIEDDPLYEDKLAGLGNPALVKAMRDGDWNIVEGAFFSEWRTERHVLRPVELPSWWMRFRSGDWGSAKPYAFHWIAVASDDWLHPDGAMIPRGALIVYRELYGIRYRPDGTFEPDTGVKESADVVAGKVRKAEEDDNISFGVLDPAAFAVISGPSIAEEFANSSVFFQKADNKRIPGHNQFRKRLMGDGDGRPMIYFFENCLHAIRTIPTLQHDLRMPEDVDTNMEDHCFAAGTLVETISGPSPIESLVGTDGLVLSLGGFKEYRSARLTGRNRKLLSLCFEDGTTIKCTPDHRFMTDDGWVEAQNMVGKTCILEQYRPLKGLACLSAEEAGRGDTYCLTVPETECFAVEGGLLVSNCFDSVRYGVMSRPWTSDPPRKVSDAPLGTYGDMIKEQMQAAQRTRRR